MGWKLFALSYFLAGSFLVEREPMWDGNIALLRISDMLYVEREPMWDGNCTGQQYFFL